MTQLKTQAATRAVFDYRHPVAGRRALVQAGAIGLMGIGMPHLAQLRALAKPASESANPPSARRIVFVFLSGGAAQHETFDPKPLAPAAVRGEFQPIATRTPGIEISEHLPLLAERSQLWALCRSLTHKSDDHDAAHQFYLGDPIEALFSGAA